MKNDFDSIISNPPFSQPEPVTVYDPANGTGAFLSEPLPPAMYYTPRPLLRLLKILSLLLLGLASCVSQPTETIDPANPTNCANPTARCVGMRCQTWHPVTGVCEGTIQCDVQVCAPGLKCRREHLP
jgi:hypothetical protein